MGVGEGLTPDFCILLFCCLLLPALCFAAGPEEVLIHRNTGLAYLEQDRYPQALEAFQRVADLAPEEALGFANAGLALIRMQRLDEAEAWLKKALARDPAHAQAHALLAEVYEGQRRGEEFLREIGEAIRLRPSDARSRYRLVRYDLSFRPTPEGLADAEAQMRALYRQLPANAVVRLRFGEALLRAGKAGEAQAVYRAAREDLWNVPDEAVPFLEKGLALLSQGRPEEALRQMIIFENVQKGGYRYQSAISEVLTSAVGLPVERFSEGFEARLARAQEAPIRVAFSDATREAGLGDIRADGFAPGDCDGDGDVDVYVLRRSDGRTPGNALLRNDGGRFVNVTAQTGVGYRGAFTSATFADFDNDGDADLFACNLTGADVLARNDGSAGLTPGPGRFVNVAAQAGLGPGRDAGRTLRAAFVDYDHDGDLDLLTLKPPTNNRGVLLFRNNGDGTFAEVGEKAGLARTLSATDAAFGDFDEDGDLDLAFAGGDSVVIYTNLRQGRLAGVRTEISSFSSTALSVSDFDNDGFLDVFAGDLYRNRGDGRLLRAETGPSWRRDGRGMDARSFDFDNDGWLDLIVVDTGGPHLFRNVGGRFQEASGVLPQGLQGVRQAAPLDADGDGDLDLLVLDGGRLRLLRNDGGNANGWLDVRLAGLNTGNTKNNSAGVGAKVEVKAGALYQMRYVADPITHFGLGRQTRAEVLRVVWTNGVPQSEVDPKINTTVVETQILKGSCPMLYAWDGERHRFVTDLLWPSPLGMLMDDGRRAFSDAAQDYVKVRGDQLRAREGVYSLRITEELWETVYLDEVRLMAVDHPAEAGVYVDERFRPPPFPPFRLHTARNPRPPVSATDDRGRDALGRLRAEDGRYVDGFEVTAFQGVAAPHGLTLDLGVFPGDARVTLFLNGWVFPTDTSLNLALSQRTDGLRGQPPSVEVPDREGRWQTVIPFAGFPNGKRKTCVLDLTGKFLCEDRRVRISTNMQVYWDRAFFTVDEPEVPTTVTTLTPARADLRYRGFSRVYREGENGPHLFDYEDVKGGPAWRDLEGDYTRYGDVTPLLLAADDQYAVMNAGDEVALTFDAGGLPPLRAGWARDFVLYSNGWVKDGDINTAHSQTVGPLPYHGVSAYPYGPGDAYPADEAHRRFLETYQTRRVTNQEFRDRLKNKAKED